MQSNYYAVIMAGGVGARFWPVSRSSFPKQFIDMLGSGESLLQQTFKRFANICPRENILVVTSESYKSLVLEQIPEIGPDNILCEPSRKNTAPCIAYANYRIQAKNPDAVVVVAPSDHYILKQDVFEETVLSAMDVAEKQNWILTLGIRPSYPNTGYGYIQYDDAEMCAANNQIKKVKIFTEKPDLEMARSFIKSGDFLWNAGIFIWSLKTSMEAIRTYLPDLDSLFASAIGKYGTAEEEECMSQIYPQCRNISIDYGVMEKAQNVYVASCDLGWSDLGTWNSLYELRNKDKSGNSIVGRNVMTYDTHGCIVHVPKEKLVVLQGLEDCIVVENEDVILICKRSEEQQIRQFVTDVTLEKGQKYV